MSGVPRFVGLVIVEQPSVRFVAESPVPRMAGHLAENPNCLQTVHDLQPLKERAERT